MKEIQVTKNDINRMSFLSKIALSFINSKECEGVKIKKDSFQLFKFHIINNNNNNNKSSSNTEEEGEIELEAKGSS